MLKRLQGLATNFHSIEIINELLDAITDLVFLMKVEADTFSYVYMNKAAKEMLGINKGWNGKTLEELLDSDTSTRISQHYQQAVKTKKTYTFDDKLVISKKVSYSHNTVTPIVSESNEVTQILCVARDITERKVKENQLQEAYGLYHSLLTNSGDPILIMSKDNELLEINPAFEQMYDWSKQELIEEKELAFVPEAYQEEASYLVNRVLHEETITSFETNRMTKDGKLIDVSISLSPIHDTEGNVVAISSVTRDITEQKQEETDLEEGKSRYSSLFNYNPSPIFQLDLHGIIVKVNQASVDKLDFEKDEFKDMSILELVTREEQEHVYTELQQMLQGKMRNFETVFMSKQGKQFIFDCSTTPIVVNGAIQGFYCITDDKTEKVEIFEKLQESEANYRLITDHSHDLIIVCDATGTILYASPSHSTILGKKENDFIGETFIKDVHEDDQKVFKKEFYQSLVSMKPFSAKIRINSKHRFIWFETKGTPVMSTEGTIDHVILVARDISEQKQYEKQLEEMAFIDHLTNLPNRRLFEDRISKLLALSKRKERNFAVLYLDGDNFKAINDEWGHDVGDAYLSTIAERLSDEVRDEDTVARMGGDEFAVLVSEVENIEDAYQLANRIRERLTEAFQLDELSLDSSFSIGFSIFPQDGLDAETLLENADLALYAAKDAGKNKVLAYQDVVSKEED